MKKTLFFVSVAIGMIACNSSTEKTNETAAAPAATEEKVDLPYTISEPDNWEHGSMKNVEVAMKALKAFENKDAAAFSQYIADSVHFATDGFDSKLSKDSMVAMLTSELADIKSTKIEMNDFETVISHDKKQEYVSLWYKQTTEMNDGKIDSVICMDDIGIKDGKITVIEEKVRHYPAKK